MGYPLKKILASLPPGPRPPPPIFTGVAEPLSLSFNLVDIFVKKNVQLLLDEKRQSGTYLKGKTNLNISF